MLFRSADTRTQVVVAATITTGNIFIDITETMCGVEIVVGSIVDGRLTHSWIPSAVGTGDEQHIAQVARIGHGVLFISHNLVQQVLKLSGA